MGGEHAMEHYDVCIGPNLTCMNDLMNRMGQFDHVEYKGKQVKCRSSCEDQVRKSGQLKRFNFQLKSLI